jgi:hypothetical protein
VPDVGPYGGEAGGREGAATFCQLTISSNYIKSFSVKGEGVS